MEKQILVIIAENIEQIKSIILKLNMDLQQDLTTEKENSEISKDIQRIQMRLNNYQNKYDRCNESAGVCIS